MGEVITRILFVCLGNICRSPTAEATMRCLVAEAGLEGTVVVDSAGTGAWHLGEPPDRRAVAAAAQRGIALAGVARQVRQSDFDDFHLLVAMDGSNRSALLRLAPDEGLASGFGCCGPVWAMRSRYPIPITVAPTGSTRSWTSSTRAAGCCSRRSTRRPGVGSGPSALVESLEAELGDQITAMHAVGGGDINDAWRVDLASGGVAFVKSRSGARAADFHAEAAGLEWLGESGAVPVPSVVGRGDEPTWLALGWVERGSLSPDGAEALGRGLAELHRAGAGAHGALPPDSPDSVLRIGSVELPIEPAASWPELYGERLLRPLVRRAIDAGSLGSEAAAAVEAVISRLDQLCGPAEQPARLHGDLWSGNVLADGGGTAWLIDPAAYGGHREVDLAMLRLFGAPSERIFSAYDEAFPLAAGHRDRVELFQLLPLLVHAVLFGGSYGSAAGRAARRFL